MTAPTPSRTLVRTTVNRRHFLALAGGIAGSALLAACGSSKATATPQVPTSRPITATTVPTGSGSVSVTVQATRSTMIVEAGEYFFRTNGSIPAGVTTIQLRNVGVENHEAAISRLNDGVTLEQFLAALKSNDPNAEQMIAPIGGPGVIAPQRTSEVTLELKEGPHVLLCFVPNAQGMPHAALGMALPLAVTPAVGQNGALPTGLSTITLRETGFEFPTPPVSGKNAFRVINEGQQPLGLTVMRILPGKTIDDVKQFFSGEPSGPFPVEGAGGTTALSPGSTGVVALDLIPGDYIAFANDPSAGLTGFTIR